MPKKTTTTTTNDHDEEDRELSPQELQKLADGPDHGLRAHSRAEVFAKHGKANVLANEQKAREHRAKHGL